MTAKIQLSVEARGVMRLMRGRVEFGCTDDFERFRAVWLRPMASEKNGCEPGLGSRRLLPACWLRNSRAQPTPIAIDAAGVRRRDAAQLQAARSWAPLSVVSGLEPSNMVTAGDRVASRIFCGLICDGGLIGRTRIFHSALGPRSFGRLSSRSVRLAVADCAFESRANCWISRPATECSASTELGGASRFRAPPFCRPMPLVHGFLRRRLPGYVRGRRGR